MQTETPALERSALARDAVVVFIDFQRGIAELAATLDGKHLRRGLDALARLTALFDLPAVVSAVAPPGTPAPHVYTEIEKHLGTLPAHVRAVPNSFADASIRGAIAATQRKSLILAGVFTEVAVQLPALAAIGAGYDVYVVVDACGGATARTEDAALRRMVAAGVKPTSIVTLAAELAGTFATADGEKALAILNEIATAK